MTLDKRFFQAIMKNGGGNMADLNVTNINSQGFSDAFEKVKTKYTNKNPINSSDVSLDDQLKNFKDASFSNEDDQALYEDLLSI